MSSMLVQLTLIEVGTQFTWHDRVYQKGSEFCFKLEDRRPRQIPCYPVVTKIVQKRVVVWIPDDASVLI